MYTPSILLALTLSTSSILVSAVPLKESNIFTRAVCTKNSGQQGTCISTADCSAQGGSSEAGHCPGAANIQCCTVDSACPTPTVNDASITLIKRNEQFVPTPYSDVGNPAIGYGHQCQTAGCTELSPPITEPEASQLMMQDLQVYQKCITAKLGSVALNENQYGALASFTFNLGCGALEGSTLARRLLAGEDPNTVAEEEFPRWVNAAGQVSQALVRRRQEEVALFETYSDVQAFPVQC